MGWDFQERRGLSQHHPLPGQWPGSIFLPSFCFSAPLPKYVPPRGLCKAHLAMFLPCADPAQCPPVLSGKSLSSSADLGHRPQLSARSGQRRLQRWVRDTSGCGCPQTSGSLGKWVARPHFLCLLSICSVKSSSKMLAHAGMGGMPALSLGSIHHSPTCPWAYPPTIHPPPFF